MEHIQLTLKEKVMKRVYRVFLLRRLVLPVLLRVLVLTAVLYGASRFISFSQVIANMPSPGDFKAIYDFALSAFSKTEAVVHYMVIAVAALFYAAVRDLVKNTAALRTLKTASR